MRTLKHITLSTTLLLLFVVGAAHAFNCDDWDSVCKKGYRSMKYYPESEVFVYKPGESDLKKCMAVARDNRIEWHVGGYITGNFASGAGYDPGVGILAEGQARWKFLELKLGASTAWQHKKHASFGYVWGFSSQLRGYFWKNFYALGAYSLAGYKSIFDNGAEWEKYGDNFGFGGGYQTAYADFNIVYFLKETSSPNKVQYAAFNARWQFWKSIWAMGSVKRMTFDQMSHGQLERWAAWTYMIGLGVRF